MFHGRASLLLQCRLKALGAQQQRLLRIACASGFWGDTAVSTPQLIHCKSGVEYIVYDYLSEITMSILSAMKAKKREAGFCPDFPLIHMKPHLKALKERNIKVISNAGGLNPLACANQLTKLCADAGVGLRVAAVTGDDLHESIGGVDLRSTVGDGRLASVNAYFGAEPVARALDAGADIVITGRCVDSALVLGPLLHERGWALDDYNKMALGSLAGHVIECGAQATGGISTDWHTLTDWHNIGFPIVEFDDSQPDADSFIVTKPAGTGGAVNRATVAEQICYEIDDPQRYLLPDVELDMSQVRLDDLGDNRVRVSGVHGRAAPETFKVTATYQAGYRCTAVAPVIGPRAVQKATTTAEAIVKRCERIFKQVGLPPFVRTHLQLIGAGQSYGPHAVDSECREVMLWLAVEHSSREALGHFAREIAPAGTGMAPGLTTLVGGRPAVSPLLKHCSWYVPRSQCQAQVHMDNECVKTINFRPPSAAQQAREADDSVVQIGSATGAVPDFGPSQLVRLEQLAYTRSGDKGDTCNIGVIARDPADFEHLKRTLSADLVAHYFAHLLEGDQQVNRYELPGISALNFVLPQALGGGGVASLRPDPQGKAYGQMLLDLKVPAP